MPDRVNRDERSEAMAVTHKHLRHMGLFGNWRVGPLSPARQIVWIISCVVSLLVFPLATVTHSFTGFTSVSPPITGATDFITDFPTCLDPHSNLYVGPIGVLFDGTHFFATDPCNGYTYRFTAAGGSVNAPDAKAQNLLTHGLALDNGIYYGASEVPSFPGWPGLGVYQFDPNSLAITKLVGAFPTGQPGSEGPLAIAPYPLNTDLLAVSSFAGLYNLQNLASPTPTLTQVSPFAGDGIAYSQDGSRFYEAAGHVYGVDLTQPGFPQVLNVDLSPDTPDGMAVAQSYALAGGTNVSNNVFVNTWLGNLVRIDTNNGNAVSTVASGGSRGDFVTVGADGCLYATQSDRVEKMSPCFFAPFVAGSNTLPGSQVSVVQGSGTVTFGTVTTPGSTSVMPLAPATSGPLPPPPNNLVPGTYLDVATTATYSGPVTVCFDYVPPGTVSLFHFDNTTDNWVDVTTSNTPQLPPPNSTEGNVCGQVSSLSPFLVAHSIQNEVKGLFAAGEIKNQGLENALLSYLDSAASARAKGNCKTAGNILGEFIDLVKAQSGKGIVQSAAANLITDTQYLIGHCSST
jgi:hypothetical protein